MLWKPALRASAISGRSLNLAMAVETALDLDLGSSRNLLPRQRRRPNPEIENEPDQRHQSTRHGLWLHRLPLLALQVRACLRLQRMRLRTLPLRFRRLRLPLTDQPWPVDS